MPTQTHTHAETEERIDGNFQRIFLLLFKSMFLQRKCVVDVDDDDDGENGNVVSNKMKE